MKKNRLTSGYKHVLTFCSFFPLYTALIFALPTYFTALLYGIKLPVTYFLLAYIAGFAIYSFNKGTDKIEDTINRPEQKINSLNSTILSITCAIIVVIASVLMGGTRVALVLSVPVILGYFYSKQFFHPLPRFKNVLYLKNSIVAFSVAFLGAFLSDLTDTVIPTEIVILVFLYIFIQIFINTVLFDVIDIPGDKKANINTLPVHFGKKKTRCLLLTLNSLLIPWLTFCITTGIDIKHLPIAAFGILYSYCTIWYFTKNSNKHILTKIFVDGQWIILTALIILT